MQEATIKLPQTRRKPRSEPKGRQVVPAHRERVAALCAGLEPRADLLVEHLHRLNDGEHALRRGHLAALAERLRLSQTEVYEVATFYHHFEVVDDDAKVPAITVRVCESLSCAIAGSAAVREQAAAALKSAGRDDVRVIAAPCIGRCHEAPAACIGQHQIGHADARAIESAVEQGQVAPREPAPALASYLANGGYATWRRVVEGSLSGDAVLTELERSGMRGLGGAGFPSSRKWRTVMQQPAPRHMVVNIDEGEVGTFKDAHVVASDPHRCLEGMLIAAQVVGCDGIWIYLRDEYHDQRVQLQAEIDALCAHAASAGWTLPVIDLRRGAGAYICGEESSLIESLEGKRGLPRLRPPIVAQVGLFGRPTLAHNVETLSWLRDIIERGGAWFASHGRRGRTGLRRFSVSGRVAKPGVHLAPAGITLRELVDEFAGGMLPGHQLYAYLPGGASGGILPERLADIPLDFDTLAEHGCFVGSMAVVVLSQHDRARDAALNLMQFFEHESCGQCTPCREGTAQAVRLMGQPAWNQLLLSDLSRVMRDASICGLGQAAPNPVDSIVRFFPEEVSASK